MNDLFNKNDYEDFINTNEKNPSIELDEKIIKYIKHDLNPDFKIVFIKLLGVQSFIGLLTLLFCPQFKLSLTNNHHFYHYFHHTFGAHICYAICGSIFLGSGAFFASYLLKKSEIKKIRSNIFLYYFALSIVALSTLILFGAEVYLTAAISWSFGAATGGLLMIEINNYIRNLFSSPSKSYSQ